MIYSLVLIAILFFLPTGLVAPIWQKVRQRIAGSAGDKAPQPVTRPAKDALHASGGKIAGKGETI
jgi:branched-chain amino acid transport system permease protein